MSTGSQPVLENGLSVSSQKFPQVDDNYATSPPDAGFSKQRRAPVGKKLVTRPSPLQSGSFASLSSQASSVKSDAVTQDEKDHQTLKNGDDDLFNQVYEWLQHEKSKHKAAKFNVSGQTDGPSDEPVPLESESDGSPSLDKLEKILIKYAASRQEGSTGPSLPVRRPTRRRVKGLRRGSASESDYADSESGVPSVEAVLDNSKTLGYTGGAADDDGSETTARRKDRENWLVFKGEIVRLAHTLRLKGWRRISMEDAGDIDVVRLSGALTNAVYVVTPPKNVPASKSENGSSLVPKKPPPKLLLRIYGPQVEHLIDRDNELQILRRLGRKNIGPRVLGTFKNGRFEEYFEARPLTPRDLRVPETSNHIAKRMKELHEGIELLREEREGGPLVLKNWDKWVDRCEQVTTWLDKEIQSPHNEIKAQSEPWRRRGLVCGVPWPVFRKAVDNYRSWLVAACGGTQGLKQQLVFAHNDTQYGNLLRMEPQGESPLLLPANEHKQLVVIDFEYASANTPGFEFANHFTEWCYNYHDPEKPWACNPKAYPLPAEQHRFISTYLSHQPGFTGRPESTPLMRATQSNTSFPSFHLDAGATSNSLAQEAEKADEDSIEANVQFLMAQQRLWRVINSAQWIAWGIVQAKIPGMEEGIAQASQPADNSNGSTPKAAEAEAEAKSPVEEAIEEDGFDYLAYAQDRAMFFWADLLALNLADEKDLPPELVEVVKTRIIQY
ncbi:Choline kinase [Aspergillus sclerotialis]|uniref:Choline kinase n=1 Tax=Aspergillus sclerotialis TaxID=2070753 RepID=A0A3A2ZKE4_9EURO|nr:Choline kinase [Aspergillus sclerotialis]